ncbi:asparaginase, partial [Streptomyces sp. adm13(2018)]|uniref:asparaginase domain-containing protein n=2 Tax=unclassified Streptomyces TaxID=2593676 RepID=UPI0013A4E5DC
MARVTVFTLGGTISARGGDAARMSGREVLAELGGDHDIVLHDFRRVPSSTLTHADLAALAAEIRTTVAAGSGAVVVQGTDTLEETAFLLDLLCTTERPVVVTGAMRRPDLPGADGPANLAAALAVAADPACRDLGVLVVMADEIHAARHARKTHTTSVATFASPGTGPLGHVVEGAPRILFR